MKPIIFKTSKTAAQVRDVRAHSKRLTRLNRVLGRLGQQAYPHNRRERAARPFTI